jgi:hypothetical protein
MRDLGAMGDAQFSQADFPEGSKRIIVAASVMRGDDDAIVLDSGPASLSRFCVAVQCRCPGETTYA